MSQRKCVVLSCVSFETSMIVEPTVSYGADEVHLFHYVREPDNETGRIYTEFYEEVCSQIRYKLPQVNIVEHAEDPVYDFQLMLRDLLQTVADIRSRPESDEDGYVGPDSDILINSSAGTSEFSAAAIIASMMSPGVNSFTVGTREYTIRTEDIRNIYYRSGKPLGLTEHTYAPKTIPNFDIMMPEENSVRALRSFHKRSLEGKGLSASCMIQQLKDDGLWNYRAAPNEKKTDPKQKETMYYQRHYLDRWVANGWIEKPSNYGKYRLTDTGIIVIKTFFTS